MTSSSPEIWTTTPITKLQTGIETKPLNEISAGLPDCRKKQGAATMEREMNNLTTENLAELDKFFVVAKEYFNETGKTANMPSCVVDSCWHELMEDDAQYASFTNRSVGGRIEHMENKGFGVIEWVPIYERMFGKLANPWFVAPEGKPIVELKAEYGQEGDLRMAWDCTPLIDCPKERVQYEQT